MLQIIHFDMNFPHQKKKKKNHDLEKKNSDYFKQILSISQSTPIYHKWINT